MWSIESEVPSYVMCAGIFTVGICSSKIQLWNGELEGTITAFPLFLVVGTSLPPLRESYFYKIMVAPSTQNHKLRIPETYVKKYEEQLVNDYVKLRVADGRVWRVELFKERGEVWLTKGWEKVVKCYSLKYGNLLLFKYDESDSTFHITIFGMNGCEIEYDQVYHNYIKAQEIIEISSHDDEMIAQDDQDTAISPGMWDWFIHSITLLLVMFELDQVICLLKISLNKHIGKDRMKNVINRLLIHLLTFFLSFFFHLVVVAGDKTSVMERLEAFNSQNPHFKVIMRRSYISNKLYRMAIPMSYLRKHLKGMDEKEIILLGPDEKSYNVRLNVYKRKTPKKIMLAELRFGWRNFVHGNKLKLGDACVFELVDRRSNMYKVTVFRAD
ncbi:B3 domain-containing transcription factor VRN1-like [Chenopodium quinoa]|uniref:B3 domain-containing transcription factor VRN1-like n=1 Tax=Chenopodium quinoa TaxID=63459 RepID=UPI000B7884A0|nr:B3 domain-containing transcription factor VRN1-like [Chenopodium quinoa]